MTEKLNKKSYIINCNLEGRDDVYAILNNYLKDNDIFELKRKEKVTFLVDLTFEQFEVLYNSNIQISCDNSCITLC